MTDTHRALGRVIRAAHGRPELEHWQTFLDRIERERSQVERLVGSPDAPRVYGFNTLLGPLDRSPSVATDQRTVMDAHLIGERFELPVEVFRCISASKLEQWTAGGSGVSPQTFRHVVARGFPRSSQSGAWLSSYGSGDVVPGAWWANAVLAAQHSNELRAGDLIAMINGNFVSTGVSAFALSRLISVASEVLARLATEVDPAARCWQGPIAQMFNEMHTTRRGASGVQQPVSLRDIRSFWSPVSGTISELARAVERRLTTPSANPLFVQQSEGLVNVSQNSFLDTRATLALDSAAQVVQFLLGGLHRVADHRYRSRVADGDDRAALGAVQPPKVIRADLERSRVFVRCHIPIAVDESGGVEDLADGSLLAAWDLLELLEVAEAAMRAYDRMLAPSTTSPAGLIQEALLREARIYGL